ncbi:TrkH family potassium uptake protein [Henriciella litoralis]|uniref:TrkH family potassium uptake protein n=1 Tax=Henriciella litoralis TaxID=568102 RepID=UPI0009FD72A5|nr:TrkH family potassium uptake protein [Henriciella litoralis]
MNYAAIIRMLSLAGLGYAAIMLFCAMIALFSGETAQLHVFLTTTVLVATLAIAALVLTGTPKRRALPSDGLAFMVFFWIFSGIVCAPPFLMGLPNDSLVTALHEAVSCLTTTGHSALNPQFLDLPVSILMYRAALHLAGAIATITLAATVLAALNLDGPGIHRTHLYSLSDASFFDSVPRVLRTVALVASVCVLLVFAIEVVGGIPVTTAFFDAVSAFSTGLAEPQGLINDVTREARAIGITFGLILGSVGIFVLLQMVTRDWKRTLTDAEVTTFVVCLVLFTLLAAIEGLNGLNSFGWAISALSTSGIALVSPSTTQSLPLALQLAPALIGGAALSAAGGIKLARVYVLSRRVGQEFLRMGFKQSLLHFQFRRRVQSDRTLMGIWVYLVAYIMASVVGMLLFSFSGLNFEDSISNTVGSLTNSGNLIELQNLPGHDVHQLFLVFGMILGRLEVLAFIPLLTLSFWRR